MRFAILTFIVVLTILIAVFIYSVAIPPQFGPIMWNEHEGLPPVISAPEETETPIGAPVIQHHDIEQPNDTSIGR